MKHKYNTIQSFSGIKLTVQSFNIQLHNYIQNNFEPNYILSVGTIFFQILGLYLCVSIYSDYPSILYYSLTDCCDIFDNNPCYLRSITFTI